MLSVNNHNCILDDSNLNSGEGRGEKVVREEERKEIHMGNLEGWECQ